MTKTHNIHETLGQHILLDVWETDFEKLNDSGFIKQIMLEAAEVSGATVITSTFQEFPVQGLSGVVVLSESHISVHTYPEHGYASFDIYTCGEHVDPRLACEYIVNKLGTRRYYEREFVRGKAETGIIEARNKAEVCA